MSNNNENVEKVPGVLDNMINIQQGLNGQVERLTDTLKELNNHFGNKLVELGLNFDVKDIPKNDDQSVITAGKLPLMQSLFDKNKDSLSVLEDVMNGTRRLIEVLETL